MTRAAAGPARSGRLGQQ